MQTQTIITASTQRGDSIAVTLVGEIGPQAKEELREKVSRFTTEVFGLPAQVEFLEETRLRLLQELKSRLVDKGLI